jgi:hypothetical protein
MKKFLFTILLLVSLLISIVFSVGTYFLEDNFVTNDSAPLADPHTTEPGGQSIDAIETDGTMAIANGKLTFTAQGSPVDGDLGLRYATDMPDYMGRATFYKLKFNSLANGIAGFGNASELFGATGAANVGFDGIYRRGFGTNATYFFGWTNGTTTNDFNFLTMPNTTDSFYVAIILGGSTDANDGALSPTWYLGQSAVPDTDGCFYFVKRNATGKWLLQGRNYGEEQTANVFPAITNYNGAFSVDRWAASNDTLRDGYLSPIHLQKMTGTAGNQLFDDTPEVGAAYDSVHGNWQFTADNKIQPVAGTGDADWGWLATVSLSDDDIFIESSPTIRFGDGTVVSHVFRYNPGNDSGILCRASEGGFTVDIYTFDGTTFTQRATTGAIVSFPSTNTPTYLAAAVYDSSDKTIMKVWYQQAGSTVYNVRYTHSSTFNSGQNRHGIEIGGAGQNTEFDEVRIYPLGTDDEFIGLDAYFGAAAAATTRRRWIVQ